METAEEIDFKNDDIVKIKIRLTLYDKKGKSFRQEMQSWWKVIFKDSNGTFIGRIEKYDNYFRHHKIEFEDVLFKNDCVSEVLSEKDQICYSDGVTVCDCNGLCRNK